ncbi:kinase-like domain-containing protein [Gigaspora rosea]|uniref:Kinase-like domain-containing protein n=1 Tax=Gigaspora rosea TaxID=44941 RepID=A0A397TZ22_9GLOM|nr:kinase-like domain-containing protein [Gigaspora rosea]
MDQIHQAGMIHRDLHPGNILSGSVYYYQICDLGLSIMESEAHSIKHTNGVLPYLAPEILSDRNSYTQAAYVYAFDIIMWEISSCKRPFSEFNHDVQLAIQICQGVRPEITEDTPPFYRDLMVKCWHVNPAKRPTAKEIKGLLSRIVFNGSPEISDQLDKADETRQRVKKETQILHHGDIYSSRSMSNIIEKLATMNFDDFVICDD